MRTTKELLEVMLKYQDFYDAGLCAWVNSLHLCKIISTEEGFHLKRYIKNNRPNKYSSFECFIHRDSAYYWEMVNLAPRIKWIKKHIKKLS
jgi:hypothetical protein